MPIDEPGEFDPIDPTPLTMIKQSHPSMFVPEENKTRKTISLYGRPNFKDIHITPDSDDQSSEPVSRSDTPTA